jgi:hypothetical protein
MKRPNGTQYANIGKWLQEQQKTNALNGLTFPKIAKRASAELATEISPSTIQTLARQYGFIYRKMKQPDLLEDKSPTDSTRIKDIMNEQKIIHNILASLVCANLAANMKLQAICKKFEIEVPK